EIVQVYMRRLADVKGPKKTLRAYQRVRLKAGECKKVVIDFPHLRFENWDEATQTMRVTPGEYEILVGGSSDEKTLTPLRLTIK
ncbi:MAG: fibronectin type III-like domain-contianing protein, partial [Prevotella sp.]|nr:fibronectin type III-like domain-contianing protein [Prevotella sp.]